MALLNNAFLGSFLMLPTGAITKRRNKKELNNTYTTTHKRINGFRKTKQHPISCWSDIVMQIHCATEVHSL